MIGEWLPIVESGERGLCCRGHADREYCHRSGTPHPTVILLAVGPDGNRVMLYERRPEQSYPGTLDLIGGHVRTVGCPATDGYEPSEVCEWILQTAVRELDEELKVVLAGGQRLVWTLDHVRIVGTPGTWSGGTAHDVEHSTIGVVGVTPDCEDYWIEEEVAGTTFRANHALHDLDQLIEGFRTSPQQFAPGAARVLDRLSSSESWAERVRATIVGAASEPQQPREYRCVLGGRLEGEPGGQGLERQTRWFRQYAEAYEAGVSLSLREELDFNASIEERPVEMPRAGEVKRWLVEVWPAIEGPGPGDGSDGPAWAFTEVLGTREDADREGKRLCQKHQASLRENLEDPYRDSSPSGLTYSVREARRKN